MIKRIRLILATGLLLVLTGCFSQSVDELYAPPKAPDDYLKLDEKINEMLNAGGEYAAPLTGELTQKVQLQDLDGDGVQEAIAFFRVSSDERQLKICIYRQSDQDYELAAMIESAGTAINVVGYQDVDGVPGKEIIVGWQQSDKLYSLAAYSIHNDQVLEMMRTEYTDFQVCDLDMDGINEIVVIHTGTAENGNRAELYDYRNGMLELDSAAPLSRNITGLSENGVRTGQLQGGAPAGFVGCLYSANGSYSTGTDLSAFNNTTYSDDGHITDIFAWKNGKMQNITLNTTTGESDSTIRWYTAVSAKDINQDGILELPDPYALNDPDSLSIAVNFWAIRWLQYDINGNSDLVFTTYYNDRDRWYFILPESWEGKITVSRNDVAGGERAVIFSYWEEGGEAEPVPFLVIYALSGDNRFMRANMAGRFRLLPDDTDSDTIYAARLLQCDWDCGLDEEGVRQNFALITNEWSYEK